LFGGLPFLAPFHSLVAWTFATFIVGHVYMTTTGATPLEAMRAMVTGYEEVEVHEHVEAASETLAAHESPARAQVPGSADEEELKEGEQK
jgi:hypothetical protein